MDHPPQPPIDIQKGCRYCLDNLDCEWLKLANEHRRAAGLSLLTESDLEVIITEFETQANSSIRHRVWYFFLVEIILLWFFEDISFSRTNSLEHKKKEHKEKIRSLGSKLFFILICSIRICFTKWIIFEKTLQYISKPYVLHCFGPCKSKIRNRTVRESDWTKNEFSVWLVRKWVKFSTR